MTTGQDIAKTRAAQKAELRTARFEAEFERALQERDRRGQARLREIYRTSAKHRDTRALYEEGNTNTHHERTSAS